MFFSWLSKNTNITQFGKPYSTTTGVFSTGGQLGFFDGLITFLILDEFEMHTQIRYKKLIKSITIGNPKVQSFEKQLNPFNFTQLQAQKELKQLGSDPLWWATIILMLRTLFYTYTPINLGFGDPTVSPRDRLRTTVQHISFRRGARGALLAKYIM